MGVADKASLGVTVGLVVAGQVPDDQALVATAREQHVGAIVAIAVRHRSILNSHSTGDLTSQER